MNTAPQPSDAVTAEPPPQRITNPTAVFAGLDKITGRIISFDVAINETVQFGALQMTPRVVLLEAANGISKYECFCRSRRGDAAGRDQAHFHGMDVCREPGPARGRTSRSMTFGLPTAKAGRAPLSRKHRPEAPKQPPRQQQQQQRSTQPPAPPPQRMPPPPGFFPPPR